MRKLIICGGDRSGKTFLAMNIAAAFDHVVYLSGRNLNHLKNPFFYDEVTEKTELIIVDDVNPKHLQFVQGLIFSEKIKIDKMGKKSFSIDVPNVIITMNTDPSFFKELNEGVSFYMRCKIIDTWLDVSGNGGRVLFCNKEIKPSRTGMSFMAMKTEGE